METRILHGSQTLEGIMVRSLRGCFLWSFIPIDPLVTEEKIMTDGRRTTGDHNNSPSFSGELKRYFGCHGNQNFAWIPKNWKRTLRGCCLWSLISISQVVTVKNIMKLTNLPFMLHSVPFSSTHVPISSKSVQWFKSLWLFFRVPIKVIACLRSLRLVFFSIKSSFLNKLSSRLLQPLNVQNIHVIRLFHSLWLFRLERKILFRS